MSNTYNMNQFKLTDVVGVTMNPTPNTLQCQVDALYTGTLIAGDAVVLGASVSATPTVVKQGFLTGNKIGLGVVLYNAKIDAYTARMMVSVGLIGTIVSVLSGGSVNRGDIVGYNAASGQYGSLTGSSESGIGTALDIGTTAGTVIRILIQPGISLTAETSSSSSSCRSSSSSSSSSSSRSSSSSSSSYS